MPSKLRGNWCSRANVTDSWLDYGVNTQTHLLQPGCLETSQNEQLLCPRLTWKSGDISWFKNPQNFEGFVFWFAGHIWYISIRKVTAGTRGASSWLILGLFQGQLCPCWEWFTAFYTDEFSVPAKRSTFFRIQFLGMLAEQVCYLLLVYISHSYMPGGTHHIYNVIASKYKLSNAFFFNVLITC